MSKKVKISKDEYKLLKAAYNTVEHFTAVIYGLCPKCGKCLIINGYRCFECGYDYSMEDTYR